MRSQFPCAYRLICKWFLQLNIKLFKVRINSKKGITTLVGFLFLFNVAWTTLMPSLNGMLAYSARTPIISKVLFSRILPRLCTFLIKSAESLKWDFSSLTGGWSTSWDMLAVMQNLSLVILGFMPCVFLETYKTPEFFLLELPALLLLVRLVIFQILVIWLHRWLFFCTTWLVDLEFFCKTLYCKLSVRLTMQSSHL